MRSRGPGGGGGGGGEEGEAGGGRDIRQGRGGMAGSWWVSSTACNEYMCSMFGGCPTCLSTYLPTCLSRTEAWYCSNIPWYLSSSALHLGDRGALMDCTLLGCTLLGCTLQDSTGLYFTCLYSTQLYSTGLYSTRLYSTGLYYK